MTTAVGGIKLDLAIDGSAVPKDVTDAVQKQLKPVLNEATKALNELDDSLKKVGANSGLDKVVREANQSADAIQQASKAVGDAGRDVKRYADTASAAYKKVAEAAAETKRQQQALQQQEKSGNGTWIAVQSERVKQAKKAEADAIKEAAKAYSDYERAARSSGQAGTGGALTQSLRGAAAAGRAAGTDAGGGFAEGFGASTLAKLKGAGGPASIATIGIFIGKTLVQYINEGMGQLRVQDAFQASLGISSGEAARYGRAAGEAYANGWGESVEANLKASQFAVQGGLINRDATDADIQAVTEKLQAMSGVMGTDIPETARAAGQLIRGGLARNAEEAMDIIVAGFQKGNNVAGDWLDTLSEYSTQFRKLGLQGPEAVGLIQQGLAGAARDSDVVADSIKEFSIRAVDGSKTTAEGFAALGFNADDMASRFAKAAPLRTMRSVKCCVRSTSSTTRCSRSWPGRTCSGRSGKTWVGRSTSST